MNATHGYWCNSRTYPCKCPGCGDSVFFFHCDCGSRVFFDALGQPWPIHDCETSWTRKLVREKDASGRIAVRINKNIVVIRPPESFEVDGKFVSKSLERIRKNIQDPIKRIDPPENSGKTVEIIGVLREKKVDADVVKALRLSNVTTMAAAFIGPLAKGKWGKATLHEKDMAKDILNSYTIWVHSDVMSDSRNSIGVVVSAQIEPLQLPGAPAVWLCRNYEILG